GISAEVGAGYCWPGFFWLEEEVLWLEEVKAPLLTNPTTTPTAAEAAPIRTLRSRWESAFAGPAPSVVVSAMLSCWTAFSVACGAPKADELISSIWPAWMVSLLPSNLPTPEIPT